MFVVGRAAGGGRNAQWPDCHRDALFHLGRIQLELHRTHRHCRHLGFSGSHRPRHQCECRIHRRSAHLHHQHPTTNPPGHGWRMGAVHGQSGRQELEPGPGAGQCVRSELLRAGRPFQFGGRCGFLRSTGLEPHRLCAVGQHPFCDQRNPGGSCAHYQSGQHPGHCLGSDCLRSHRRPAGRLCQLQPLCRRRFQWCPPDQSGCPVVDAANLRIHRHSERRHRMAGWVFGFWTKWDSLEQCQWHQLVFSPLRHLALALASAMAQWPSGGRGRSGHSLDQHRRGGLVGAVHGLDHLVE